MNRRSLEVIQDIINHQINYALFGKLKAWACFGLRMKYASEEVREKSKKTNLDNCGFEYASQSPEVKEKVRQTRNNLKNRPIVSEIRKYKEKFALKLGSKWFWKEQELLDNMLLEFKMIYGEI